MAVRVPADDRDGPVLVRVDLVVVQLRELRAKRSKSRIELVEERLRADETVARHDACVEVIGVAERGKSEGHLIARPGKRPGLAEPPQPSGREVMPRRDVCQKVAKGPAGAGGLAHPGPAEASDRLAERSPRLIDAGEQLLRSNRDRGTRHTSPSRLGPARRPSPSRGRTRRTPA